MTSLENLAVQRPFNPRAALKGQEVTIGPSFKSPRVYRRPERVSSGPSGGPTWWAHYEFTRTNIEPAILRKQIEELMNVKGIGEKSLLKLKLT